MSNSSTGGNREFQVSTSSGNYDLYADIIMLGDDMLVAVWGGEKPHIGAVAMAQPRPSLKDASELSATASVFTYVGHKEDELAKLASETISKKLNKKVVVTAGMHWDDISESGILQVIENSEIIIKLIVQKADM